MMGTAAVYVLASPAQISGRFSFSAWLRLGKSVPTAGTTIRAP